MRSVDDPKADEDAALALPTSAEQAIALGKLLHDLPGYAAHVRKLRQAVVERMHEEEGMSWDEIGKAIKQHRTRAAQIARGVPGGSKKRKPEQQNTPPAG